MDYTQMLTEYNDILLPEDVQKILHIGGGKYRIPKLSLLEFIYPDIKFTNEAG